eukprot:CAMPEP_0114373928 /NCGR_PEP_ID=MMETSP0101-20121206/35223_1 /TAXON_ID=38822 ORGANISM="Pteridomonas danica, Strain PT" /NCGR_SAMPLE_ID=MMETSP0101 /ASSEMBLY_ACC=CAM_ASM_000211 /LENGTH=366 /DNA_ID=CAMNT_0001527393 /DNA_START=1098 /DNA_END=2198 /DNA_ORIENTATION=-
MISNNKNSPTTTKDGNLSVLSSHGDGDDNGSTSQYTSSSSPFLIPSLVQQSHQHLSTSTLLSNAKTQNAILSHNINIEKQIESKEKENDKLNIKPLNENDGGNNDDNYHDNYHDNDNHENNNDDELTIQTTSVIKRPKNEIFLDRTNSQHIRHFPISSSTDKSSTSYLSKQTAKLAESILDHLDLSELKQLNSLRANIIRSDLLVKKKRIQKQIQKDKMNGLKPTTTTSNKKQSKRKNDEDSLSTCSLLTTNVEKTDIINEERGGGGVVNLTNGSGQIDLMDKEDYQFYHPLRSLVNCTNSSSTSTSSSTASTVVALGVRMYVKCLMGRVMGESARPVVRRTIVRARLLGLRELISQLSKVVFSLY